ncbi:unnamed protein product, partial [Mesorhabditis belari]|uniref:peptidyl-tRNA hydrolase n=1 Tax=Mesorhabditis belari TaxID=2138241 RepID=A0AAF3J7A4_9BILA
MLVFVFVIEVIAAAIFLGSLYVWYLIRHAKSPKNFKRKKVRTLVVMGSGGHTTEMTEVLKTLPSQFECVFVLADTDRISQGKVEEIVRERADQALSIERIPRSREVGQSYFTSILTTLVATMHALRIVWNTRPDLVLTNGPGTCIPICVAAFFFDLFRLRDTPNHFHRINLPDHFWVLMTKSSLKFWKVGLPFFTLLIGSAYGLHFFQEVRYDFRRVKKEDTNLEQIKTDLSKSGIKVKDKVTVEDIYKEIAVEDTENWTNIRGPHENEDNSEYFKIQKEQREQRDRALRMAERIPAEDSINSNPTNDQENPPEPTLGLPRNDSLSASIRAERGSPTPEVFEVDSLSLPEIPAEDPAPSIASSSIQANQGSICSTSQLTGAHPVDPQADQANPALLSQLIELGFDDWTSKLALQRTRNAGVEAAVNWIIERSNESDFESSPSSDEEEPIDQEMGAAQSGEGAPAGFDAASLMKSLAKGARTHKMVFVANMGLKMGTGKLAAQVGHACLGLYQKAVASEEGRHGVNSWERMGAVKIVVKGESTEQLMNLFKQAKEAGCVAYLVQDAGYTQIPAGSRTILGVFGPVEAVDSVTGSLKLL